MMNMTGLWNNLCSLLTLCITAISLEAQIFYHDTPPLLEKIQIDSFILETRDLSDSLKQEFYKIGRIDLFEIKNRVHAIPDGYFDVFTRTHNHWKNQYKGLFGEYNFGSVKLVIDQKIYSYGGSGYWRSVHSIIGFLSEKGEWELIKFAEDLPDGIAYEYDQKIHIFGLQKSALVNLRSGQYEILSKDSLPNITSVNLKHFLENDKWLFTRDSVNLYLTEKKPNTTYLISLKNTPFYKVNSDDFLQIMADSVVIYKNNGVIQTFIPERVIKTAILLKNENRHIFIILSLILFLIVLLSVLWRYNRVKFSEKNLVENDLRQKYKDGTIAAILPYRGNVIDYKLLDALLGIDTETHPDTKKYKRAQLIKEINDTFWAETNQKLIIRERGSEDGRKYMYRIN